MILLIGGSSHVGKTYLSQKLMERLNIPYVSIDHIKMMFIRSGLTKLTVEDDVEMRYFLWPYLSEYIKTAIENDQNLILEGCYIPENFRDSFSEEYLKEIKAVYIVMSEEYLRNNFKLVIDTASVIEKRLEDDSKLERLIMCSKEFKHLGMENDIPIVEIDKTYDVEKLINELLYAMKIEK